MMIFVRPLRQLLFGRRLGRILLWMPQVLHQADELSRGGPLPPHLAARARARWRSAYQQVRWLLKFRRFWAEMGQYLQIQSVKALTEGLERRKGVLRRVRAVRS